MKQTISFLGCALLFCGLAAPASRASSPQVEAVSFSSTSDGSGVVVRISASERVSAYQAPRRTSEDQLQFVIYNATLADAYTKAAPRGPVRSYTVHKKRNQLIFRFRLKPSADLSSPEAYRDRSSNDLLLNFSYGEGAVARRASDSNSAASTSPDGERWDLDTIVLDAGHGGHDPGAQAYGLDEKDVVLAITRKLGGYIEKNMKGVDVLYTRKRDRFVPLRERGRIANRAGAKLFISVHANAARNRAAHGTETYFLGMHKTKAAARVMERENSVIQLEDNPDQYDELRGGAIMQSLAQSAYMHKSEQLSGLIQRQFEERAGRKNRGVKQAGFLVLWAASMPAVLVETGFITNAREATFLGRERGQTYIASAIFRAVRNYKKQYEKGLRAQASN